MQCTNPLEIYPEGYEDGMEVPCGKCYSCRIAYRRQWSARMTHELPYHDRHLFLTLTYDDDNVPYNDSLQKIDLQNFFKRLRKNLAEKRKIKHFSVGEYGERTQRPHYHSIIFGVGPHPEDKDLIISTWPYADWSVKSILNNAFGHVSTTSIQYVAQYIDKKFTGELDKQYYQTIKREPVFRLISQGIGKQYCLDNAEQLSKNLYINYNGQILSLPRYYITLLRRKEEEDNWFIFNDEQLGDKCAEKERMLVKKITGKNMTFREVKCNLDANTKFNESRKKMNKQKNINLMKKMSLKFTRDLQSS